MLKLMASVFPLLGMRGGSMVCQQEYSKQNQRSEQHWRQQSGDYDGVMGGYGHINDQDIEGSLWFLMELHRKCGFGWDRGIDVGGGVGRISKQLLCKHFRCIDLVEREQRYVDIARSLGIHDEVYKCSLNEFYPSKQYDCVWIQWVCLYMSDEDIVELLKRMSGRLNENGVIVVKENVCEDLNYIEDESDGSVTRNEQIFLELFKQAGLRVIQTEQQIGFPKEIYRVQMYGLQQQQQQQ